MTTRQVEWAELVAEWRASGQTARAFAAAHGVTDTALRYWAGRLAEEDRRSAATSRRRPAVKTTTSPPLARVVRPGEEPSAPAEGRVMVIVGKATIVVERGFDDGHLRDVVRALSGAE
jgi:transposase-like protein